MKSGGITQRLLRAALVVSAVALFVAVAFPHAHNTPSSHRAESCRACKIQEGFSAAPPAAEVLVVQPSSFVFLSAKAPKVFHAEGALSLNSPRAPPHLS